MTVTQAMLGNAAVAAVLALLALAIGCACRSPAVRHVAWVVVLLKLVTPPLFSIPLPVLPASWNAPSAEPAPPASRVPWSPPSTPDTDEPTGKRPAGVLTWWDRSWAAEAAHAAL